MNEVVMTIEPQFLTYLLNINFNLKVCNLNHLERILVQPKRSSESWLSKHSEI